jgi:MFS family permease
MVSSVAPSGVKLNTMRSWIVCFSAALFFFYAFIQMMMFNAVEPLLFSSFHANAKEVGFLASSYFYGDVPFLLIAGLVLDRCSTRKVLLWALVLAIVGTFIFAVATHIWLAAVGRFLVGVGCAFCFLGIVRLISRWFTPNHMALIIGLVVTLAFIGGMVAQTPLSILMTDLGWRSSMSVDGFLGIIIFWVIFIFVKDAPCKATVEKQQQQLVEIGFWKGIGAVAKNLQNWCGGIYTCATNLPVFVLGSAFGTLFLTQVSHFTRLISGDVIMIFFLGLMVGSPLFGFVSDRMQNRKLPMLVGAIILLATLLIMMLDAHITWIVMAIVFFMMGFASGAQVLGYPMIAESNNPCLTATAESLASALIMAGGIAQQWVGSILQAHWTHKVVNKIPVYTWHDYKIALSILPVASIIAIIAVLVSKETNAVNITEKN